MVGLRSGDDAGGPGRSTPSNLSANSVVWVVAGPIGAVGTVGVVMPGTLDVVTEGEVVTAGAVVTAGVVVTTGAAAVEGTV